MAEQASVASSNEITLNIKGPSELKLSITISTDKTVLELKQAIAEKSDVSADRQRLIYSGRVLKDEDVLSTYKVQNAHTVHMVKGAPKPTGTASSSTSTPTQPLPSMQTGQTSTETLLNGPRGHGALAGLNMNDLFGGANPNDPNMLQNMLSSPQFMQQMSRMMSDPNLMDTILAQSPHLTNMDPNMRRTLQSPEFRQMMSNPDTLRNMMQMTAALRQAGINPMGGGAMGGGFGGGGFGGMPFDLFGGGLGGAQNQGQNQQPSGNLFEQAATGATSAASPASNPNPTSPSANTGSNPNPTSPGTQNPNPSPFGMIDPQGNAAGGNPFAALGAFGAPPAPPDPRPVEERFQVQLQQLQDMGFTNAQQNVRALLACGGRVDSAIEYILGGGGLQ
ncbi:Heat shock chaperonin-binding motif, partial [Rhizoctonia solani]